MKKLKDNIVNLYNIIMTPSMAFLPGNLAFFLVLSLFPILTLIGVIASKFSINVDALINVISSTLPVDVANMINSYIQGKGFDTNVLIFMLIGFFLASNGSHAIILASNNLYGFPNSGYIKRRIKAFFIIILLLLLFIFMLGFVAFGNHIVAFLLTFVKDASLASLINKLFAILKWPFVLLVLFFNFFEMRIFISRIKS